MSDLQWLTVKEAGKRLRDGDLTSVELTQAVLDHIDATGDVTKAYVTVTGERAMAEAEKADADLAAGQDRGPFQGIPYCVKDLVAVKGAPMTVGSKLTNGFEPEFDAAIIERLNDAGAVCVGKTVTHEFAWGSTSPPTRNPWDGKSVTGGSSGGTGAAVGGGQALAGLGTDCCCSIRNPSALNGITGIRPSYGLVPLQGVVPVSLGMDTIGPMCRTVEDTALMLDVVAGYLDGDPSSIDVPVPSYAGAIGRDVAGLRVGVPKNFFFDKLEAGVEKSIREAIAHLESLGMELVEVELPHIHMAADAFFAIVVAETAALHNDWLYHRADDMGGDVRVWAELGNFLLAKDYVRGQQVRHLIIEDWKKVFEQVDVVVTPSTTATAKVPKDHPVYIEVEYPDGEKEDVLFAYGRCLMTVSVAGLPAVVVPSGLSYEDNLPVGLQIVAPPFDEATAFAVAHAYETSATPITTRPPAVTAGAV
jgi:aspartyl-tRNA(Asn)/glutamyl-tRNA(Gln) amidotransferase subunit A